VAKLSMKRGDIGI